MASRATDDCAFCRLRFRSQTLAFALFTLQVLLLVLRLILWLRFAVRLLLLLGGGHSERLLDR